MHILLIPSWYPRNSHDISGCFFREQAIALAQSGHKVGVLSFNGHLQGRLKNIKLWKGFSAIENDEGVWTWRIHHVAGIRGYGRIILPFWVNKFFKQYASQNGVPEILHAHSALNGGLLARMIGRRHDIPYVITEHSSAFPRELLSPRSVAKAKLVFDDADRAIAVSSILADCVRKTCNIDRPIAVVPNILNQTIFSRQETSKRPNRRFAFLNIGLLTKNKGQHYLIRAFAKQFRNRPLKLLIGGGGEERPVLERLIESLEMQNQIRLLGMLSREEVQRQMSQCDAFVLSSLFETFGVVLIEALSSGKPVVATRCGGPEDIMNSFNGVLVEKESIDDLAAGMERLYQNHGKFDPDEIREDCLQRFGQKAITTQLTQIYENILACNSSSA